MNATTAHHCPVCKAQLHSCQGSELDRNDGVTESEVFNYCPAAVIPPIEPAIWACEI